MLDTVTSATISTMARNYSHCPLKKRPIQFLKDENISLKVEEQEEPVPMVIGTIKEISRFATPPPVKIEIPDIKDEPENLCTKPEDLSRKRYSPVDSTIPSVIPVSVITSSPVTVGSYPPKINSPQEASAPVTVFSSTSSHLKSSAISSVSQLRLVNGPVIGGGAFHRVVTSNHSALTASQRAPLSPEPLHYHAPNTWHRSISAVPSTLPTTIATSNRAPQYPPAYFPLGYPAYHHHQHHHNNNTATTNEIYHPYPLYPSPPSPYAPRDSSCSPPSHLSSIQHQSQRLPLTPIALLPSESSAAAAILSQSSLPSDSFSRAVSLSPTSPLSATSSIRSRSPLSTALSPSPTHHSITRTTSSNVSQSVERRNRIHHRSTIVGNNAFATSTSSTSHVSGAARHQCPDCGKSYSTFSGLSKHRQFHCAASGDGPRKSFSCKYCEKIYISLGALKMHIRTHTLPCKCTLCGKAFSRPWLLQGHIRTHTGEKPFSCQHCHRAFADRSNLRAHLQTHSDIKKYSCPTCSKTFSRMSLLTKHAESGGCNNNNNGTSTADTQSIRMTNNPHATGNTNLQTSSVSTGQIYTSIPQIKHHPGSYQTIY